MGIVVVPSFGADPVTVTGPTLDAKVDGLATEFNGNIDNDNVKSAAAIANSKLNLASISQNIAHSGTMTHTGTVTITGKDLTEAKCADIASASTTTIWAADGNFAHITGTTTITSFGTAGQAGDRRIIVFDGALTLTHNATSLILPTGANITTAAGDTAIVIAETTANARVIAYLRKDGSPLISGLTAASGAEVLTGTESAKYVVPSTMISHEGMIKAWAKYTTVSSTALVDSFNIGGISDDGEGLATLTIGTDFAGTGYVIVASPMENAATDSRTVIVVAQAAGTCQLRIDNGAGAGKDAIAYVMMIGDR